MLALRVATKETLFSRAAKKSMPLMPKSSITPSDSAGFPTGLGTLRTMGRDPVRPTSPCSERPINQGILVLSHSPFPLCPIGLGAGLASAVARNATGSSSSKRFLLIRMMPKSTCTRGTNFRTTQCKDLPIPTRTWSSNCLLNGRPHSLHQLDSILEAL